MAQLEYFSSITQGFQQVRGSGGRLNVSSRSDSRSYYNSRDSGQTFSLTYFHDEAVAGEISTAWQNTSIDKTLVISAIGVNSDENARIKLHRGTVTTLAGGAAITPFNLNGKSQNTTSASAVCRQGTSGSQVSGITSDGEIDFLQVLALGHEEIRLLDRVRLGQDQAIYLEYNVGTTGDFFGVIFGYYEVG